jgi:hypothetical protein
MWEAMTKVLNFVNMLEWVVEVYYLLSIVVSPQVLEANVFPLSTCSIVSPFYLTS